MMQHRIISLASDKKQGAEGARTSRGRANWPLLAVGLALVAGLGLSIRPPDAAAATLTFQVTSTADAPDASPGDGICADAAGQCTLRAAVQEADAQPSGNSITIAVPAGTFALKRGVLPLTANTITIQGAGGGATTVDGRNASQVFSVSPAASVTLGQLTIIGGNASLGGGIQNAGTLMLTNSTVTASVAASNGGGIYNQQGGTLTLAGTTVSQNVAGRDGGGIANNGGTVQLSLSTVSGNKASQAGGGIVNFFGTVSISQSTIAGNAASGKNSEGGGGIANGDGTLTVDKSTISGNSTNSGTGASAIFNILTTSVSNSTISGNTSPQTSGSILNSDTLTLSYVTIASNSSGIVNSGSVTATGTIIADSTQGPNCFGNRFHEPFGFNLDSGTSCRLSQATDLSGTDPLLAALASNGGPTQTRALEAGSPAIDHGGTSANGCPPTDQRGVTRPQGPACDIGAFEFMP
jgi:CSLREA domain-containing protein